jgi:hypothetical protein
MKNMNSGSIWTVDDNYVSGGWGGSPYWIDHTKVANGSGSNIITTTDAWTTQIGGGLTEDELEFFELVLAAMGVDITYEDFKKMSPSERKSLLREVKINMITK